MNEVKKGILLILSGPAGSGKGTVVKEMMKIAPEGYFAYSVSATTRAPRVGETNGKEYFFITKDTFEEKIASDEMLEYAQYCGNYYGTPKAAVKEKLEQGINVILEIEVQGAMAVKEKLPEALAIMITPPDFPTLEARLRGRGTNTEEDICNRLARSREELMLLSNYDYVVVNRDNGVTEAAEQILTILQAQQCATKRNLDFYDRFFGQ
ncbi:MAG: guanylate kinase [Ruminococcaceae bacterium]|nr:guanylate kinase [Oscillospiraceae bacterium]